jgi:Transferase family
VEILKSLIYVRNSLLFHFFPDIFEISMTVSAEMRRSSVTVFAKSTAPSMVPVEPGKTHEFTALDHSMSQHFMHLVYYYKQAPTLTIEALKESLCDVLSHHPPMMGRLAKNEGG